MKTPASVWCPSHRRFDPQPPRWEYPSRAWVLKVDPQGKIELQGRKWKISKALCGEWVQLVAVEHRVLVYYCATLFREIDRSNQTQSLCKDV